MATTGPRREGILSTAPRFLKIIRDPLQDTLRIPPRFVTRYGQNLPNRVFLKVPSGSASEVELIQSNGETFLQKGWKGFKERYSIGFGHLLVFKYNGNCQFDVLIFDVSATEINYNTSAESDDSVVVSEHRSRSSRGKTKAKMVEQDSETEDIKPPARQHNTSKRKVKLEEDSTSEEWSEKPSWNRAGKRGALSKESSPAYQKATAFASDRKFTKPFFICQMQPSYVSGRFSLNVPRAFARENLPGEGADLTLRLRNGKKWWVRCNLRGAARMSCSWKYFAQDNGLQVGDACIFQVAKDCVWNVIIFRS